MSAVVHIVSGEGDTWCKRKLVMLEVTTTAQLATCLPCLLACAEYGSEARHRREVLIESGAKP